MRLQKLRVFILITFLGWVTCAEAQNIIPQALRVDTVAKTIPTPTATYSNSLNNISAGFETQVFPGCSSGSYFVAFQLYFDLNNLNTEQAWSSNVDISFKYNGVPVAGWSTTKRLKINTVNGTDANQVFVATLFHDDWVPCSTLYTVKVDFKNTSVVGTPPEANILFKVLTFKRVPNAYLPSSVSGLTTQLTGNNMALGWTPPVSAEAVVDYDVEWVFISNEDGITVPTAATAFTKREPVRVSTASPGYSHQVYYPTGKLWYRVRPVGFNPNDDPQHRIPGNWVYSADAGISITNHQAAMNWQQQTVFAEEGKYKKVMTYYDGTLRQRQALTNLSTENLTLLSDTRYDFEGRKSVDVLPAPVSQFTDSNLPVTQFTNIGTNLTISSNNITKNAGSGTGWTGAFSVSKIKSNESGWVEMEIVSTSGTRAFGLSPDDPNTNYNTIDYAFHTNGTALKIYENGTQRTATLPTLAVGNKLRIERVINGSTVSINYLVNDVIKYTSTIPGSASTILYGDFSINTAATVLSNLKMSTRGFDYVPTLAYLPTFNAFQALDATVSSVTASGNFSKFHYDNKKYTNSIISNLTGSSRYYSTQLIKESIHSDYTPDAEGYVYSQTEYLDDGTGRVKKQSGVGKRFQMDSTYVTKSFYGSPDPAEVVRLFGSNVGNATHYKKNIVIDPNGQASVTYLDQEDRVIATALAGAPPQNVLALPSYTQALASDSNYVNIKYKNQKSGNVSTVTQRFIKSGNAAIAYRFVYDVSSISSQIENVGCIACSYDLRIVLTDPDGFLVNLSGFPGNQSTSGDRAYVRTGLTTSNLNCSSLQSLATIVLKPNLTKPGTYTFTKTLTAKEQTFEEVKTVVSQTTEVQTLINEIKLGHPLDSTQCDICNTCSTGQIIEDAIGAVVDQDCENIRERIRQQLIATYGSDPNYVATDSIVALQPGYCEYELCVANKASDEHEKKMSRISNWAEAVDKGYDGFFYIIIGAPYKIIINDPFFNGGLGSDYVSSIHTKLDDIFIGEVPVDANNNGVPEGTTTYHGSVLDITNPDNGAFYVKQNGTQGTIANGKHILYSDLQTRKANGEITNAVYLEEVDKQRWLLVKSFYLEAKRKTKLEIPQFQACNAVRSSLMAQDSMPIYEEEIKQWEATNPLAENSLSKPVSNTEVSAVTANFKFFCPGLTPSDTVTIFNDLKAYFQSKPENFLRLILQEDLNSPALASVKSILQSRGCSLDSLAEVSPTSCATYRIVTWNDNIYYKPISEATNGGATNCSGTWGAPCLNNADAPSEGYPTCITTSLLPFLSEYQALLKVHEALGSPKKNYAGWKDADPNVVQCVSGWSGVCTDASGHIIVLNLSSAGGGYIHSDIYKLTYLKSLTVYGITGVVPEEVGSLTNLQYLGISQGNFAIPDFFGNLTNLKSLKLTDGLHGYIPPSISQLTNLSYLTLSNNEITGDIPESLGNLTNLYRIDLSDNNLTGKLPESLGSLTKLEFIDFSFNALKGNIPLTWGNFACRPNDSYGLNCVYIDLSHNKLNGVVPYKLKGLSALYMDYNNFHYSNLQYIASNSVLHNFTYSHQDSIDVRKIIKAVKYAPFTLSTTIDVGMTPASTYRWYKNGVPITNFSTTGYNYTISNVGNSHAGEYFYVIKNSDPNFYPNFIDSLISRKIKLIPVTSLSRTDTICTSWDTTNPTLKAWTFEATQAVWDSVIQRCMKRQIEEDSILIEYATNILIDSVATDYYSKRTTNCLANVQENISYTYKPTEYHYTLYYYDQAGNLVQTVPPNGVVPLSVVQVNSVLNGNTIYPQHSLITRYQFNSLNQSSWQNTPDAGTSQFWYNSKGQLRMSQNAQQLKDAKYSYTKYDKQGRITEVGELYSSLPLAQLTDSLERNTNFPKLPYHSLYDYTRTYYDEKCKCSNARGFAQYNLRSRVSYVEVFEKDATDTLATFYSYDIHGNVKALLQHLPKLGNKRTDYQYHLVSGKVNYVIYQYNKPDQFIHKYTYDADNRIREVFTSIDGWLWDRDALYMYYLHGPLARVQLGERFGVQGLDYYYTLQGWVKGVNMPYHDATVKDLAKDGYSNSNSSIAPWTGRDVFAYTLGYFNKDYKPRGGNAIADTRDKLWQRYKEVYYPSVTPADTGYYNGNIAWMITDLKRVGQAGVNNNRKKGMQAMLYQYDQLHRIRTSLSLTSYTATGFATRSASTPAAYDEKFTYDPNGNILTLQRWNNTPALMDDFNYTYYSGTNRLRFTKTVTTDMNYTGTISQDGKLYRDITIQQAANVASGTSVTLKATNSIKFNIPSGQTWDLNSALNTNFRAYVIGEDEGTFNYDGIGNLVADQEQGTTIVWTPYGKIRSVTKADGSKLTFRYDATGNRIEKRSVLASNTGTVTRYVRDASGNVMAVYTSAITSGTEGVSAMSEQPIYGSSRLGMYKGGRTAGIHTLGLKNYELSNHLGNVLSVITDQLRIQVDSAWAKVVSAGDYYAFGGEMPGRSFPVAGGQEGAYRYGFNGKEHDTENTWGGTSYDYGFRIYNPKYARFLSVDPLTNGYPWYTPYQFAGNKPIIALDLDGLEEIDHRILETVKTNAYLNNVNTDLAPDRFMGEKTRVNAETGRKWNAKWTHSEINKLDPTFWSDANKIKIVKGELPTVDEHYLNKIGNGLSPEDMATLRNAVPAGSTIHHHHINHGRFAAALPKSLHQGYSKFWHNSKFKNNLFKGGAKAFVLLGVAFTMNEIIKGNPAGALAQEMPIPTPDMDEFWVETLLSGLTTNSFEKVRIGVDMLKDFSVEYWSADNMVDFLKGNKVDASGGGSKDVDVNEADKFPYLNILFQGKSIGIVEIPDKIKK